MKAIIINGEIYLKPRIPNDWKRPNGAFVLGYINKTELHFDDGWREFEQPTFDPATHKKTTLLIEINNVVTYEVLLMTPQEIEDYLEAQAEGNAGGQENTRSEDGKEEVIRIFRALRRKRNEGVLTANQFKQSQNLLFDALLPLNYGLWDVAKLRLDGITNPANQTLLNILNQIRGRIDNYILENLN